MHACHFLKQINSQGLSKESKFHPKPLEDFQRFPTFQMVFLKIPNHRQKQNSCDDNKNRITVEPLLTDTPLIWTPLYFGQFPCFRQSAYILYKEKLYNTDPL